MKRARRFFWQYKQFSLAVLGVVVGGGLTLAKFDTAAHWVLGAVSLIAVIPLVMGMWEDVRSGQYGLDVLALTAIVSAVLLHQYWAAIIVVIMLTGGESLEDYAEHRARSELDSLLKNSPQSAHILRGSKTVDVPVAQVSAGDKLVVKPGEVVPVDAVILDGKASFDESSLTGEPLPHLKSVNEQILSGSVNLDGAVTIKALHSAQSSQYQQIIRLVQNAQNSKAPFVRLADRYSIPFTAAAFAIAIAVWVVSGHAIRFLEVIIVATPCPLLLAAPIALISGMSRASKYGIVIKTGSALEQLADVRTVAFDKTGTLTKGQPSVTKITTFGAHKQLDVLSVAASLEQSSSHVLARAVLAEADRKNVRYAKAKHVSESAGHGLSARIKNADVLIGRLVFLRDHNVDFPPAYKPDDINQTASYVAIDGKLAGVIFFEDSLRPEAKMTLENLRKLGAKQFLMLTGDNASAAQAVADTLGITQFEADATPAAKVHAVERVTEKPVAFVGDGVNDAPVLTAADIGIALGARGSTAASESADVVILKDDLSYVVRAIATARRAFAIARQSILVGIGISVLLMLMFATGRFSPVLGAILQEVVDVIVIFNALRAHNINVMQDF